eukprot:GILK01014059.1.p1 GENE.GILK01014059.1~~GILK01014059.1.p1  ORF type:complete len:500 (+),score=59.16 GILK01014059.1:23-1522(+)
MWSPVLSALRRRTRLVATLGPSSSSIPIIRSMVQAGVDVVRLNFSHGTYDDHKKRIDMVRAVSEETGKTVAILQDLCGPKIRTTKNLNDLPIPVLPGTKFTIKCSNSFLGSVESQSVGTIYPALHRDVQPGDNILLSDGLISMKCVDVRGEDVVCEVVYGGLLKGSQGINLPGSALSASSITPKDVHDLHFGLEHGVDLVAVSFIRSADDIFQVKKEMKSFGKHVPVIAKIEKPQAMINIHQILDACEGVMVARGDLGVELPPQEVPIAQKKIIAEANRRGIPVIVATQMLESMIEVPRPTRAEVSDVSNAIFDGADACMLSAETAAGKYPLESVQMMTEIAQTTAANMEVDHAIAFQEDHARSRSDRPSSTYEALGKAVASLGSTIGAAAIVVFTLTGSTARQIGRHRPSCPIVALSTDERSCRQLVISRNVLPFTVSMPKHVRDLCHLAEDLLVREKLAVKGDTVIITGSHPFQQRFAPTNFVKLLTIGAESQSASE